jgi:alkylation response protein AidB-like acyl-CoA dehydrogenase
MDPMAEYRVEQLARDAKVSQIYAGTDEIQVSQIARDLLSRHRSASRRQAMAGQPSELQ